MPTLRIEEKIVLQATVDRAWRFLLDPARVASCLPGASLDSVEDERTFSGTIKVKVGPVTTDFKGRASFTEVVTEEHRVKMSASGSDQGGSGHARMTMTSRIVPGPAGGCGIQVTADVDLAGKLVRFGRGMMEGVGKQLFKQFAARVQATLDQPEVVAAAPLPGAGAAGVSPAARTAAPAENAPLDASNLVLVTLRAWIKRILHRLFGRADAKDHP